MVEFIDRQMILYGGRLNIASNEIKPIICAWLFDSDKHGFQVITDGNYFTQINGLFTKCLGTPDIATENAPGRQFVGYNIRKAGVAVQYAIEPGPLREIKSNLLLHLVILNRHDFP